ncbi:MAG: DUF3570 domain-containing protein [Granulosicoccaceae bacterium]
MQLKPNRDLKRVLAAASASLLALNSAQAQDAWEVDAEILYYQEQDDRVQDVSFKSLAKGTIRDDDQLTLSLQYDTLTGASPTGAATQNATQTFTSASGGGNVVVPANELPLDDAFRDNRTALSGHYQHTLANGARFSNGLTFSKEYDYLHLGVNTAYAFDFNNNNRTLSVGLSLGNDTVESVGGNPVPNTFVSSDGGTKFTTNEESKTVFDFLIGFTQIINRRSLVQFNYSATVFEGYLNDPYKFISVLDDDGSLAAAGGGQGGLYRYENRPDSRTGHNFYVEYKYRFDRSIANLAYRFHTDDWGINSHTVESRYRWLIDAKQWLEPNIRIYSQSAADFYTPFVFDSNLPSQSSSDYRLNEFNGVTVGLSYKRKLSKNNAIGFSVESYRTTGADASIASPTGDIVTAKSTDLTASIFRLNYSFKF